MKKSLLFVGLMLFSLLVVACSTISAGVPTGNLNYDDFAKCLTQNGAKMYGAFWCSHCNNQKQMFGSSVIYINYIECSNSDSSQNQICQDEKITGYPTWRFKDGSELQGEVSIVKLSDKTDCSLDLIKGI